MKLKITPIPIIMMLALLSFPMACSQAKNNSLLETMKVLPDTTTIVIYLDVGALKVDSTLAELYEGFDSTFITDEMSERGISLQDPVKMIIAVSHDSQWLVIKGMSNLKEFRLALADQGLEKDEHKGVEIWNGDYSVAFLDDMVIMTETSKDVRVPIQVAKDKGKSMYDNADMKPIAERLPSGFFDIITSEIIDPNYTGYTAVGISVKKPTPLRDTLEVTEWFKFSSEKKARAEVFQLEDRVERQFDAVKVTSRQNNEFVKVTGEVDVNVFARSVFWQYFFPKN